MDERLEGWLEEAERLDDACDLPTYFADIWSSDEGGPRVVGIGIIQGKLFLSLGKFEGKDEDGAEYKGGGIEMSIDLKDVKVVRVWDDRDRVE